MHYYNIVRGVHLSAVKPNRIRKSISAENTFANDLSEPEEIQEALHKIVDELLRRIEKTAITGRTLTLKIKYADFELHTRSKSLERYILKEEVYLMTLELLNQEPLEKPVRLFGIGLSNLNLTDPADEETGQLKIKYPL